MDKNVLNKPKNNFNSQNDIINYLIEENTEKDIRINDLLKLHNEKQNWIKLFGIYNTKDYLIFYLFGIKISIKMNEERVNKLAWWIPIRKWRDGFRDKFFR